MGADFSPPWRLACPERVHGGEEALEVGVGAGRRGGVRHPAAAYPAGHGLQVLGEAPRREAGVEAADADPRGGRRLPARRHHHWRGLRALATDGDDQLATAGRFG